MEGEDRREYNRRFPPEMKKHSFFLEFGISIPLSFKDVSKLGKVVASPSAPSSSISLSIKIAHQ